MASFSSLPPELLLCIPPLLPLKSPIQFRSVSKRTRSVTDDSHIHLTRRQLLDLYLEAIHSPSFIPSRRVILPALVDFNREEYIQTLERKYGFRVPEEMRIWILEWPARAVFTWVWPGLPFGPTDDLHGDTITYCPARIWFPVWDNFLSHAHITHIIWRVSWDPKMSLEKARYDMVRDRELQIEPQVDAIPESHANVFHLLATHNYDGGEIQAVFIGCMRDPEHEVKEWEGRMVLGSGWWSKPPIGWIEYLRRELERMETVYSAWADVVGGGSLLDHC